MNQDYWQRQNPEQPLFDDLLWSRPENRAYAGKLLIVGGNGFGFAAAAEAYGYADKAGAGSLHVLLPDALQKTVANVFPGVAFAPSTPSGSFASKALGELLPTSNWADAALLAGDLGRNSETAILLESYLRKTNLSVTATKDAVEYLTAMPEVIKTRGNLLLVLSFSQLQKLAVELRTPQAFVSSMDLLRCVAQLHALTLQHPVHIITKHLNQLIVAVDGQVTTTACSPDERIWRLKTASSAAVWWMQNQGRPLEALTTSLVAS